MYRQSFCKSPLLGVVFALCVLANSVQPPTSYADITAKEVESSIRMGVRYLKERQQADGGWPEYTSYNCGLSGLCTLALANAGVLPGDPNMTKALEYLRRAKPTDTYSVSLQTLALCQVGLVADLPLIRSNVVWLIEQQTDAGAWTYRPGLDSMGDPSNAQFALLALAAAEERGIQIKPQVYEKAAKYWRNIQSKDGGWAYSGGLSNTGSMTCAGIASSIICRGHLNDVSQRIKGDQIQCCGNSDEDDVVERGLQWLAAGFSSRANPGATGAAKNTFYYLYALERVGRMSGRRLIGDHDWYREGAEFIVRAQDRVLGFWATGDLIESNRLVTTSFALLFLSKGKRQVAIGLLDYQEDTNDIRHPDGARQLVRALERDWGRDLTWQVARLEGARVADLLQTPVLVISGNEAPKISPEGMKLLKDYVDQSGFLVFEANAGNGCGPADGFQRWVQTFCTEYLGSPLERLPPDHPLWFAQKRVDPATIAADFWVYGVQACCRTGVVYVPQSLSCRWELSDPVSRRKPPAAVEKQLEAAVALGQNIVAYATGRELKEKLELRSVLTAETSERAGERGVLAIAQLGLDAGGLEAKRAIPNLARYIDRFTSISITTDAPIIALEDEPLSEYALLWFHGRRSFELNDQQVRSLRTYLENGGMLFADSICGDESFQESFRREMRRVLPESPLQTVPADHPLMTADYGGFDLSAVTLRTPQKGASGAISVEKRRQLAVLEAAVVNDRVAVVFSPYDLSCALESQSSIQCPGYATDDAARIGINLVLFALRQ